MASHPLLRIERLTAGYGPVDVIQSVDLSVAAGQIVAVLGANGSGKSTFLKSIMGLAQIRAGSIQINGTEVAKRTVQARVAAGVCYLPQGLQVFPSLSVRQNIEIAWPKEAVTTQPPPDNRLFAHTVLRDKASWRASALSGGERQIVALARALWRPSRLLLLDEPFLGLSEAVSSMAVEMILSRAAGGSAVIIVEQNLGLARMVAGDYVQMAAGKVLTPITPFGSNQVSSPP